MVFGANPSTATPGVPDHTIRRINTFVLTQGFDGWIVFNLYPLITTNPDGLPTRLKPDVHRRNLRIVNQTLKEYPIKLSWAAWGNIIEKRNYMGSNLRDILKITEGYALTWNQLDPPTLKGHPRHPLYHRTNSRLLPFNPLEYLKSMKPNPTGKN